MVYAANCDPKHTKAVGYEIFGFYLVTGAGKLNFCDVVEVWQNNDPDWHPAFYTGPGKSMADLDNDPNRRWYDRAKFSKKLANSDGSLYVSDPTVGTALNIENGGWATLIEDKANQLQHFWLFGPLDFLSQRFGSLVIMLKGYQKPNKSHTVDKDGKLHWKITYPSPKGFHDRPCTLWASDYSSEDVPEYLQTRKPIKELIRILSEARKKLTPVSLPDRTTGVVWKYKGGAAEASLCEADQAHG